MAADTPDEGPIVGGPILSGLNPEQREAVLHRGSPLLVFAGAGSGKTRVICRRIAHLISHGGVPPSRIIALTFTNKAAGEMVERVSSLTGIPGREVWISTFHSAGLRMLRADYPLIGGRRDFIVFDEDDQVRLVKRILKDFSLDPKAEKPRLIVDIISRAKDEMLGPEEYYEANSGSPRAEILFEIHSEYEKRLRRFNALDFGDLITETVRLLDSGGRASSRWSNRFDHILVDEYQDTNHAQYLMLRGLASGGAEVAVVGDDDQSIYRWRGADPRNILEFESDFPGTRIVVLGRNYRSTGAILGAASRLVSMNSHRTEKVLTAERSGGAEVKTVALETERAEASWIAEMINRLVSEGSAGYGGIAVFYRMHSQSRVIEEVFKGKEIPYRIFGGIGFFRRAEVKDLISYLRVIRDPSDEVSLLRIINNPPRGIGQLTLERLLAAARSGKMPLWDSLPFAASPGGLPQRAARAVTAFVSLIDRLSNETSSMPPSDAIKRILLSTGYLEQYDEDDPEEAGRIENVKELISAAADFEEIAEEEPDTAGFLDSLSLSSDLDELDDETDAVSLMTLHSTKGLEFDVVFISGAEEGILPHSRALGEAEESGEELAEERRLAYVGMTRAKDLLFISRAIERRFHGAVIPNPPSRFIEEAGLDPFVHAEAPRRGGWSRRSGGPRRRSSGGPRRRSSGGSLREGPAPTLKKKVSRARLSPGVRVAHRIFGIGEVLGIEGSGEKERVLIDFAGAKKKLMTKYAGLRRV